MSRVKVIALICMIMIAASVGVYADSATNFSGSKSISYAAKHWDDGVGDCTAFARACLEAGGIARDTSKESYDVKGYVDYLVDNGYAVKPQRLTITGRNVNVEDNPSIVVSKGDLFIYKCTNKSCPKPYFHTSICSGVDADGYYTIYAHNKAQNNVRLVTINCSKCHAEYDSIELYALHITSKENGYDKYTDKVSIKSELSSYNKIKVTWSSNGADSYNVFVANGSTSTFNKAGNTKSNSYVFQVSTADLGKNKYFIVKPCRSIDATGYTYVGSSSNKVYCQTLGKSYVSSVKKKSKKSVTVKCADAKGESGYQISKSTSSSRTKIVATVKSTSGISKVISAKKGTSYYYKVRTYRIVGSKRVYSPWSKTKKYKIK